MFNKMFRKVRKDNRGFTLVELMVVVVIIGVLTAIAIPVYNASTDRAKKGACEANLRMLDSALQQYYMNNPEADPLTPDDARSHLEDYFSDGFPECPSGADAEYKISGSDKSKQYFTCTEGHSYRNNTDSTGGDGDGDPED